MTGEQKTLKKNYQLTRSCTQTFKDFHSSSPLNVFDLLFLSFNILLCLIPFVHLFGKKTLAVNGDQIWVGSGENALKQLVALKCSDATGN